MQVYWVVSLLMALLPDSASLNLTAAQIEEAEKAASALL